MSSAISLIFVLNIKMKSLPIQLLLVLSAISAVWSIKCYQCNSMWNGKCGEAFRESPTMEVDCDVESNAFYPELKATFCRKLRQTIYGQVRVIRSCGYILQKPSKQNKCETFTFVKASETTYCECNKELCNGSGRVPAGWKLISLLVSTLLIVKKYF